MIQKIPRKLYDIRYHRNRFQRDNDPSFYIRTLTCTFTWTGKQGKAWRHCTSRGTNLFTRTLHQKCNFVPLMQSNNTKLHKLSTILFLFQSSTTHTCPFLELNFNNYTVHKWAVVISVLHSRMHKHSPSSNCSDKVGLLFRSALKGEKNKLGFPLQGWALTPLHFYTQHSCVFSFTLS